MMIRPSWPHWRARRRAGAHFHGAERGRFVDVDLRVLHQLHRMGHARPVLGDQLAGTHAVLVQQADRTQHTHGQLHRAHFHGEHRHGQALLDGDVLADVHRERGLAHRGTTRDDDQVAALHAGRHLVQIGEARGHAGHVGTAFTVIELVDALDHLRQQRLDFLEAGRAAPSCAIWKTLDSASSSSWRASLPCGFMAADEISSAIDTSLRSMARSRTISP